MRVVLDAMGGDLAPVETVKGAVQAVSETKDLTVILVGKQELIENELKKYSNIDRTRLEIVHTDEYISMDEKDSPAMAVRKKKNASVNIALDMVKRKEADASVSAGNTGALMTASLFKLGRIDGVQRPALTVPFPSMGGKFVFLDAGANKDCKPEYINEFAVMGSVYAKVLLNKDNPSVGLLNIGEEVGKGNELATQAYEILSNNKNINFAGNIEATDMIKGKVDVVVTDGFTGNMVLKTAEGTGKFVSSIIKKNIKKSPISIIGALLMGNVFKAVKKEMDHGEHGGAIFLGLEGISLKVHGSSDALAIKNGIKAANKFAGNNIIDKIKEQFKPVEAPKE